MCLSDDEQVQGVTVGALRTLGIHLQRPPADATKEVGPTAIQTNGERSHMGGDPQWTVDSRVSSANGPESDAHARRSAPQVPYTERQRGHLSVAGGAKRARYTAAKCVVYVQGRKCWVLVDTGADVTAISTDLAKRLGLEVKGQPITIHTANKTVMTVRGTVSVKVKFAGTKMLPYVVNAYVIDDLLHDFILGVDTLAGKMRVRIDLADIEMVVGVAQHRVPLSVVTPGVTSGGDFDMPLVAAVALTLRPGQANFLHVQPLEATAAGPHVLLPCSESVVPWTGYSDLQEGKEWTHPLPVWNVSEVPVTIAAGEVVAVASRVGPGCEYERVLGVVDQVDFSEYDVSQGSSATAAHRRGPSSPTHWIAAAIGEAHEEEGDEAGTDFPQPPPGPLVPEEEPWEVPVDLTDSCMSEKGKAVFYERLQTRHRAFARDAGQHGLTNLVELRIDTGDHPPIAEPLRRLPHVYEEPTRQVIEGWLQHKVVRPSNSPWAFPIVVVKKKGGGVRVNVDYRRLNAILPSYDLNWPITLIDSCLDAMDGAQFFTVMDVLAAYHNIPVAEDSVAKTSFVCKWGQFEFLRAPFGIKNIPGLWCRLADLIFRGLKWQIVNVFMDDLCVFSKTEEEHVEHVTMVLDRLIAAGLKINPRKCKFARDRCEFLGFVVSREGVRPDPGKVSAITQFPRPKSLTQLRSFLSLCSYYRRFVKGFSTIAGPMNELLLKDRPFAWGEAQEAAVQQLKQALTTEPVLAYPNLSKPYILYTDASDYGLGAVLAQEDADGQERVLCYASRALRAGEKHYSPTHKEALAMVWAITDKFHTYLYGRRFSVVTDHQALTYIKTAKDRHGQLHRWAILLQEYDFDVTYRPGKTHINADVLSRTPFDHMEDDDMAQNACLSLTLAIVGDSLLVAEDALADSEIANVTANDDVDVADDDDPRNQTGASDPTHHDEPDAVAVDGYAPDWSWGLELALHQRADPLLRPLITYIESGRQDLPQGLTPQQQAVWIAAADRHYLRSDGVLMRIWYTRRRLDAFHQVVVPLTLRRTVMQAYHDGPLTGHLGFAKMYERLLRRYHWPTMHADVMNHVKSCEPCAARKTPHNPRPAEQQRRPPVWAPFQRMSVDFMKLGQTQSGNDRLLVFCDHLTRWVEAFPTRGEDTTVVAEHLYKYIICRYGCPQELLSDQGPSFVSAVTRELCRVMRVNKVQTTAYHPQANGVVERANQTFQQMLSLFVNEQHDDWDQYVAPLCFAYNTALVPAVGESPYFLMYGRDPRLPIDVVLDTPQYEHTRLSEYSRALCDRLHRAWQLAQKMTAHQEDESASRQRQRVGERAFANFNINDRVWLYTPVKKVGGVRKFASPWHGPYRVRERVGSVAYALVSCDGSTTRATTVHVSRLKPYTARQLVVPLPNSGDYIEDPQAEVDPDSLPDLPTSEPTEYEQRPPEAPRQPTAEERAAAGERFIHPRDACWCEVTKIAYNNHHALVMAYFHVLKMRKDGTLVKTSTTGMAPVADVLTWIESTTPHDARDVRQPRRGAEPLQQQERQQQQPQHQQERSQTDQDRQQQEREDDEASHEEEKESDAPSQERQRGG